MDLFAVLAEVEGTGAPLAYCLVELVKPHHTADGKPTHADPGAMTYIIPTVPRKTEKLWVQSKVSSS